MPVKPRWTDRALKGAAFVVVSFLCGVAYGSSSSSPIRSISSGIAALNSGRSSGLTQSALDAIGQSAAASTPGSSGGATSGSGTTNISLSRAGADALAPQSTASAIGLWAADWGGAASKRSTAGWQAAAKNDRILIGGAGSYQKMIPQLHAWNPNLTVLVYNLGPYLTKGSSAYSQTLSLHPTWFAHDSKGRLINLPMFPGNYLMDEGNSAYRAWQASQLLATVTADGFDGAMVNSVGDAPVGGGHYASGVPVNQATGKAYTASEYLSNSVLLLNGDKAALGTKFLVFNGLISGTEYQSATSHPGFVERQRRHLGAVPAPAEGFDHCLPERHHRAGVAGDDDRPRSQGQGVSRLDQGVGVRVVGAGVEVGAVHARRVSARTAIDVVPRLHAIAHR